MVKKGICKKIPPPRCNTHYLNNGLKEYNKMKEEIRNSNDK